MLKNPKRFFIVLLLLAWTFDFLFWESPVGVNFVLFLELVLIGAGYFLLKENLRPARRSIWLLVPIMFFSVSTFLRQEPLTLFLAYLFTFFLLAVLGNTWNGGSWVFYGLTDYFMKILVFTGSMVVRSGQMIGQVRRREKENGAEKENGFPLRPVLRGILIALPIVILFSSLLASADLVFAQKLSDFFENFSGEQISETIWRSVLALLCAYLVGGAFLHAAFSSYDRKVAEVDGEKKKRLLGFIESSIVLGSVATLFLLFVIVQFQYFFGGTENIGVEGYTFSQYARRGFNELITVAFFSLVLILGLSSFSYRGTAKQQYVYSGLSLFIVVQVLIILVSAYHRITLGIQWHGFSRLRLYPRVFLIWLGLLLLTVAFLEVFKRQKFFALSAVIASLGFAVSLTLVNIDASIAKHNILRASQGRHFNVTHLTSLSTDAVPVLADEFMLSTLPESVHEGIGAALLCFVHTATNQPMLDWRSFNLSHWQARQSLKEVESDLLGYNMNGYRRVRTPEGKFYYCD
ncbi:MAG: DUF4173 domain-containing protein [Anaerolineae bacterium]|jgi:hypothetical protein|nr:DUF4173 domain-containing protein [Anaerolineae bacterium]